MNKEKWTTNNIPDLKGKVIIVTGGNSGLGYESVKAFAENRAEVILASRSEEKGVAQTNLARYIDGKFWFKSLTPLFMMISQDQAHGALPQIRAAVDPKVTGGEYYGPHKGMKGFPVVVESNEASHNIENAKKLWEVSEKLTGVTFHFKK